MEKTAMQPGLNLAIELSNLPEMQVALIFQVLLDLDPNGLEEEAYSQTLWLAEMTMRRMKNSRARNILRTEIDKRILDEPKSFAAGTMEDIWKDYTGPKVVAMRA